MNTSFDIVRTQHKLIAAEIAAITAEEYSKEATTFLTKANEELDKGADTVARRYATVANMCMAISAVNQRISAALLCP